MVCDTNLISGTEGEELGEFSLRQSSKGVKLEMSPTDKQDMRVKNRSVKTKKIKKSLQDLLKFMNS